MDKISKADFTKLLEPHEVLERDKYGIKVLKTEDGKIIKIFRFKRFFSSALISPYAQRFQRNAEHLTKLGIKTVKVERVAYCPENKSHIVIYPMISGLSLRQLLGQQYSSQLIDQLTGFIARLHDLGIYFRSLHMGNIIFTDNEEFALIDIADMRIHSQPLTANQRIRNFMHMLRYKKDKNLLSQFGIEKFFSRYLEQTEKSTLTPGQLLKSFQ